jgi:hypothetical protein
MPSPAHPPIARRAIPRSILSRMLTLGSSTLAEALSSYFVQNVREKAIVIVAMKKTAVIALFSFLLMLIPSAHADPPKSNVKSKFYDFGEQIIDGEIKKPTGLYVDTRQKVKFKRLLRFKKSFLNNLLDTSKDNVFK